MHLRIKLCGFFVAASLASTLSAAGILSDVFESYSSGTKLGTNSDWSTVSAPNGTFVIEEGAEGNPLGAQNQYLDVSDYSSSKSNRLQSTSVLAGHDSATGHEPAIAHTTTFDKNDIFMRRVLRVANPA